jgi:hypothetical protein
MTEKLDESFCCVSYRREKGARRRQSARNDASRARPPSSYPLTAHAHESAEMTRVRDRGTPPPACSSRAERRLRGRAPIASPVVVDDRVMSVGRPICQSVDGTDPLRGWSRR